MLLNDTIAAISTPIGEGGIAVIRISGDEALQIADKIFVGKELPSQAGTHTILYGYIKDVKNNKKLDEVLLSVMRKPRTFTGEDTIEISSHGGILPAERILNNVLKAGARLATPGEFTKRAFLNGRIDLTQAEAVVDIVRAKTDLALSAALQQLEGRLSHEIEILREKLIRVASLLEIELDFAEEDIGFISTDELIRITEEVHTHINQLITSGEQGRIIKEGLEIAIIGKPNVGKSSLLNSLLRENRAIVTPIPGTTRDTIEETVNLDGIPVRFIDTAGLRYTLDPIEIEGIRRTQEKIDAAGLVLFLVDGSEPITQQDIDIAITLKSRKVILVVNKIDLGDKVDLNSVQRFLLHPQVVKISATQEIGLDNLRKVMVEVILEGKRITEENIIVTNIRHRDALIRANSYLENAQHSLRTGLSGEFVSLDIREALDCLGEIIGVVTTDDILNRIFSEFCIGK